MTATPDSTFPDRPDVDLPSIGDDFDDKLRKLADAHDALVSRPNAVDPGFYNGVYDRYRHPVLTADHAPLAWRYDLDRRTNPHLMERLGVNAALNSGAIEWDGKVVLVARVEGVDRKSFFAAASSESGVDGFRFHDHPVTMPETADPDTNVYDVRLTRHADGWTYGVFCSERKDPDAPPHDTSSAVAAAGIARTKDLVNWERLPDLVTPSPQQRNVVLHPEFVEGKKYGFYTRPQDGFISTGGGGGIAWGVSDSIERPEVREERVIDPRVYHTIKEVKNGAGGVPIRTDAGWLHVAHGVRNTAAGLRYVLYAFLCDLDEPWRVTHRPGGHLLAPLGPERVGDVSNVAFCNGVVARPDGRVLIYYASSDTRTHVAASTVDRLVDYCRNTPPDALRSAACVAQRNDLIDRNAALLAEAGGDVRGLIGR